MEEIKMQIDKTTKNNIQIAVVQSDGCILMDTQSALDLIMSVNYETGCDRIAINKEAITEDFFILSTRLAGDILQKFINYRIKFSIYGDFSGYTSKPLKDFIYECNHGKDVFFASDVDDAVNRLSAAH